MLIIELLNSLNCVQHSWQKLIFVSVSLLVSEFKNNNCCIFSLYKWKLLHNNSHSVIHSIIDIRVKVDLQWLIRIELKWHILLSLYQSYVMMIIFFKYDNSLQIKASFFNFCDLISWNFMLSYHFISHDCFIFSHC